MFFPGIQQAQSKDNKENDDFDKGRHAQLFHYHGPGKNENSFYLEYEEKQGEKIIPHVKL